MPVTFVKFLELSSIAVPVEVLSVILKECISFSVAWRGMTHARKLSRHYLLKQIVAIFWIQVSVTEEREQYQRGTISAFSWVRQPNGHVLVRVPVDGDFPVSWW